MANGNVIDASSNVDTGLNRICDVLVIKRLVIPASVLLAKIESFEITANNNNISKIYFELIPNEDIFTSPDGFIINLKVAPIYLAAAMYSAVVLRLVAKTNFSFKICAVNTYLPPKELKNMMKIPQIADIRYYIPGLRFTSIIGYLVVKSLPIEHILIKTRNITLNEYFRYTLEDSNIKRIKPVNNKFRRCYKKLERELIDIINQYIGTWHFYEVPITQFIAVPIISINGQRKDILYTINNNKISVANGVMSLLYIN